MTKVPKIVHHARTVVIRYIKETCCRTYNKGTTLIFLGVWEFTYGLNDLDTCVSINVNAIIDGATRRSINGCDSSARKKNGHFTDCGSNSSASELDSDNRVEPSDSSLEGDECWVLVWEDSKVTIIHSEADTCGDDILGWHEPIILLRRLI